MRYQISSGKTLVDERGWFVQPTESLLYDNRFGLVSEQRGGGGGRQWCLTGDTTANWNNDRGQTLLIHEKSIWRRNVTVQITHSITYFMNIDVLGKTYWRCLWVHLIQWQSTRNNSVIGHCNRWNDYDTFRNHLIYYSRWIIRLFMLRLCLLTIYFLRYEISAQSWWLFISIVS